MSNNVLGGICLEIAHPCESPHFNAEKSADPRACAITAIGSQLRGGIEAPMAATMAAPRILCLIDTVGKGGGAEHLVAALAPRMAALGASIEVAPIHEWPINLASEIEAAGVTVHRFGCAYSSLRPKGITALAQLVRQNHYDIFWGHLRTGITYARIGAALGGGKSVATLHSEGYRESNSKRWRDRIAIEFEGRILGGASARVAVSNAVARDFGTVFGWDDIAVAYNGVDIDKIIALSKNESPTSARERWGIKSDEFLIVNAARYVVKKGQRFLVDAIDILHQRGISDIKLLLCGEGDPVCDGAGVV